MAFAIEIEPEADGRWFAEVPTLPGVAAYGANPAAAVAASRALVLRVLAERIEQGEALPPFVEELFAAPK